MQVLLNFLLTLFVGNTVCEMDNAVPVNPGETDIVLQIQDINHDDIIDNAKLIPSAPPYEHQLDVQSPSKQNPFVAIKLYICLK